MDNDANDELDGRPRRMLFRHSRIPVKALLPNFFTLLSLCAGLTAIRMAIEQKFDAALLLIVAAALIDGIDGRLARALKVQSRFGAELDSLADTVNFGVAPAIILYIWGFGQLQAFGWVASMVFACCMGLRLARFNAALDVEKPKWMANYFTGIPAPAGAMTVLLPLYLNGTGLVRVTDYPLPVALFTLAIAFMLVSTIPTWSGKLLGERISRDYVLPIFAGVALVLGLLWSYPYQTATVLTLVYLGLVPFSYHRFRTKLAIDKGVVHGQMPPIPEPGRTSGASIPPGETKH
jgi:CDP-diacylglycerol---serine O-phosphatidyltransferase